MPGLHIASDQQSPGPHVFIGIVLLGACLRKSQRPAEPRENRQRQDQIGLERLTGIAEGEDVVPGANLLGNRVEQGRAAVHQPRRGKAVRDLASER
jgi:hypothetical protein